MFERPPMQDQIVMAANPMQLSGLARRLVDDHLLENSAAREASIEASKTRVPFVTHLVQKKISQSRRYRETPPLKNLAPPLLDITALDPRSYSKKSSRRKTDSCKPCDTDFPQGVIDCSLRFPDPNQSSSFG